LLCAVDRIPSTAIAAARKRGPLILAEGELTGHAHAFRGTEARKFGEDESGRSFLAVGDDGGCLEHEEHDPITVPRGVYQVVRQREYRPPPSRQRDHSARGRRVRD
jgi:hypothetical protein